MLSVGDEGNKAHGGAAIRTGQGIDFKDEMNKASPGGLVGRAGRSIIDNGGIGVILQRRFISFASGGVGIKSVVADEGFIRIRDMKADAVKDFNGRKDLEITFFSWMHRGCIDNGISIFDVVDFVRREGRANNIVSKIKESLIVVLLDGDIIMDREPGMVPGAHFINQSVGDSEMI